MTRNQIRKAMLAHMGGCVVAVLAVVGGVIGLLLVVLWCISAFVGFLFPKLVGSRLYGLVYRGRMQAQKNMTKNMTKHVVKQMIADMGK